jgi:hypothetical protein
MPPIIYVVIGPLYEAVCVDDMTLEQAREAVRVLGNELRAARESAASMRRTWAMIADLRRR